MIRSAVLQGNLSGCLAHSGPTRLEVWSNALLGTIVVWTWGGGSMVRWEAGCKIAGRRRVGIRVAIHALGVGIILVTLATAMTTM